MKPLSIPIAFSLTVSLSLWYLCLTEAPVLIDPDTAWHIAAGDLWRAAGKVVADPWGWTSDGKAWINIAWAFDVAVSWLHAHTGFIILYPLCLIIVSTLIGVQVMQAVRQGAIAPALIILAPVMILQIYSGTLLRPNLITLIFTVAGYYLLATRDTSWQWRRWFLLPVMCALWANLHGGFLYMFLLFGIFGLEALILEHYRRLLKLTVLGVLCLAFTLLNPFGYEIWTASYYGMNTPFNSLINEWKPTNFRESLRMLALLVLLLVASGFTDKRVRISDRLLVFILFCLTLMSQRHSIILALFCIPYLGQTLTYALREVPQLGWIEKMSDRILLKAKAEDIRIVAAFMLAFVLVFVCSPWPRNLLLTRPVEISKDIVDPDDLIYLQTHYAGQKILNHYDLGGHLIYYGRGNPKLFIDGRSNTAYPEQVLTDYRDFMQFAGQDVRGRDIHKKYGFGAVVIPVAAEEKEVWDDNYYWKRVFLGKSLAIYEPR